MGRSEMRREQIPFLQDRALRTADLCTAEANLVQNLFFFLGFPLLKTYLLLASLGGEDVFLLFSHSLCFST